MKTLTMNKLAVLMALSASMQACAANGGNTSGVLQPQIGAGCEVQQGSTWVESLISRQNQLLNPPEVNFADGSYSTNNPYSMKVMYKVSQIAGCTVSLRDYTGNADDNRPIGPTMLIKPGQTMALDILNQLPAPTNNAEHQHFQSHGGESTKFGYVPPEVSTQPHANLINPALFNITNLHTHGWHVDPTGHSDNIFAEIKPGDPTYPQRVSLPADHVAGTFWYHAHLHGSTTIQVASGMAGVLKVVDKTKGLDAIPAIKQMPDKQMVFQQLAYDTSGQIENYDNLQNSGYKKLNRPTFINGQAFPTIEFLQGQIQRWRFVHAGMITNIQPALIPVDEDLTTALNTLYSGGYDNATPIPLNEIALDGLPTGVSVPLNKAVLYPGYRVDVLAKLPNVGQRFFLVDMSFNSSSSKPNRYLLANVVRSAAQIVVSDTMPTTAQLLQAKNDYIYGQYNPTSSEPYAGVGPLNDVTEQEMTGLTQVVHFYAGKDYYCPPEGGSCTPCDNVPAGSPEAQVCKNQSSGNTPDGQLRSQVYMTCDSIGDEKQWDCMNFNPGNDFVRSLGLNTASTWYVSGGSGQTGHTFHIHVNPFQVQRKFLYPDLVVTNPTLANSWVWKDTLAAPTDSTFSAALANLDLSVNKPLIPARLKSRYTNFTGAFVQHCHVLNHEDQGMMQTVEVEPDAALMKKLMNEMGMKK